MRLAPFLLSLALLGTAGNLEAAKPVRKAIPAVHKVRKGETAAKIANISVEAVSYALREVRVEEGLPPPRTGAVEIPNSDTPESEVQHGTMDDEPGDGDEFIEETAPTNDKERMVDRLLGRNKSKKIAAG